MIESKTEVKIGIVECWIRGIITATQEHCTDDRGTHKERCRVTKHS
jgi:hypothetical protein